MEPRHALIMLDIDGTMLSGKVQRFKPSAVWFGGSNQFWKDEIQHFKTSAAAHGITAHFGVASGQFSDPNARTVREDRDFLTDDKFKPWGAKPGCGLVDQLDVVGGKLLAINSADERGGRGPIDTDKVDALKFAQTQFAVQGIVIQSNDIVLFDDRHAAAARRGGFQGIEIKLQEVKDVEDQKALIHGYFVQAARQLNPDFILGAIPATRFEAPKGEEKKATGVNMFGAFSSSAPSSTGLPPRVESGTSASASRETAPDATVSTKKDAETPSSVTPGLRRSSSRD